MKLSFYFHANKFDFLHFNCLNSKLSFCLNCLKFLSTKPIFNLLPHNGYVYGVVWRFEAQTCQTATKFIRCNALEISTSRQMHYTRCCMLGFIHYQFIISFLQSIIRSIEALLFPKKLVFRVGKKALANRQALLQFLVKRWPVRIAIVLGCVGWLIFVFLIKRNNILKMKFRWFRNLKNLNLLF
jgi:hypothetical protein